MSLGAKRLLEVYSIHIYFVMKDTRNSNFRVSRDAYSWDMLH